VISILHTPKGPIVHDDHTGPTLVSRSVGKKDPPLDALAHAVDLFHARFGRNPAFCFAGPEMEEELSRHRVLWSTWIERLDYRERCKAVIQCGDERQ